MAGKNEDSVSVAEVKRRFSEFLSRVELRGERVLITRRGKPVAVLVHPGSIEDLRSSSTPAPADKRRGLLAAAGAWAEMEDVDRMIEEIYAARLRAADRDVEPLE